MTLSLSILDCIYNYITVNTGLYIYMSNTAKTCVQLRFHGFRVVHLFMFLCCVICFVFLRLVKIAMSSFVIELGVKMTIDVNNFWKRLLITWKIFRKFFGNKPQNRKVYGMVIFAYNSWPWICFVSHSSVLLSSSITYHLFFYQE
jgi:hypothetical protein